MPLAVKSGDQCLRLPLLPRYPYIFIHARIRHFAHGGRSKRRESEGRYLCEAQGADKSGRVAAERLAAAWGLRLPLDESHIRYVMTVREYLPLTGWNRQARCALECGEVQSDWTCTRASKVMGGGGPLCTAFAAQPFADLQSSALSAPRKPSTGTAKPLRIP